MALAEKDVAGHRKRRKVLAKARRSITKEKAKKMLRHGRANGRPLSPRFKGLLGAIAGGD